MDAKKLQQNYFDPKKVGEDLSEVALELLSVEDQEVESRWFHSQYDTDLFIWTDLKGFIIKQQLSFFGQVVEWNFVDGVKTGYVVEDEGGGGADIKASEVVHFDVKIQTASIDMAIKILEHLKASHDFKKKLAANFHGKGNEKPDSKKDSSLSFVLNRLKELFKK